MAKTEKEKIRRFDVSTPLTELDEETHIIQTDTAGNVILDKEGKPKLFRIKDAIIKYVHHCHLMTLEKAEKRKMSRIGRLVAKSNGPIDLLKDEFDLLKKIADDSTINQQTGQGSVKIDLFNADITAQIQDVIDSAIIVGQDEPETETKKES